MSAPLSCAGDQCPNRVASVGDGDGAADGAHFFVFGVHAEESGDGGEEVGDGGWIAFDVGPGGVGAAVGDAGPRAATGQDGGPSGGIVVAAVSGVDDWGAPEFAH